MALINCPECGKKVSSSAKICPHCGKSINIGRRLSKRILSLIFLFILLIILLVGYGVYRAYHNEEKEKHADIEISSLLLPYEERKFIEIYKQYRDEEKKVSNDIQRASLLNDRTRALKSLVINENITNWIGKVSKIKQFDENNMGISINVYPNLHLLTIIPNDSQFIDRMASFRTNQHVVFSGKFRDDFVDDKALSVRERLSSPLYQFILTDIKQYVTLLDKKWWDSATLEDLKQEIKRGGNINAVDDGTTVLKIAVCNKNPQALDLVRELIKNGVNINATNQYNKYAFDADCNMSDDIQEELLKHGSKGDIGRIIAMPNTLPIIKQLIKNGADVNSGWGALYYDDVAPVSLENIKILLENGADINYRPPYEGTCSAETGYYCETPLEITSVGKNLEMIDFLIKNGADVNDTKHPEGTTPLMYAVRFSSPKIVDKLIKEGANINAKDNKGQTVLMHALWNYSSDSLKIIETLIQKGANIDAKNICGETALMSMERQDLGSTYMKNKPQIIALLKKHGATRKQTDKLYNEKLFKNVKSMEFQMLLLKAIEKSLIEEQTEAEPYSGNLADYLALPTPYIPLPRLPVVFNNDNVEFIYEMYELGYLGEVRLSFPNYMIKPFLVNQ